MIRQYIYKDILRARTVNDREVELSKYFNLISLVLIQLLYSYKVFKYIVISLNIYNYIRLYKVYILLLKALNDYK